MGGKVKEVVVVAVVVVVMVKYKPYVKAVMIS